jgi:hypothetical protein
MFKLEHNLHDHACLVWKHGDETVDVRIETS